MTNQAQQLGRSAQRSDFLEYAVRIGLISYGVVHLLVAWLAVSLALGDPTGQASSSGAMQQLAATGVGRVALFIVAAGFVALVIWQLLEACFGHEAEDGAKRILKRLVSAGKAIVYAVLAVAAFSTAVGGGGGGGGSTQGVTATVMSAPGGVVLVGLIGLGILAVAVALVYRGWNEKFLEHLDGDGRTGDTGDAYTWLGKIGYLAKGVAFAVVAGLFVWAAVSHDPDKSGGLDKALREVLQQPFGPVLLIAIAVGIACYGLFCFARARHEDVDY